MTLLEELYSGYEWCFTLEEAPLPDGRVKKAAVVGRCDTVHILAFPTAKTVLLLREFRPFLGEYIWMIPTGRMNKETDRIVAAQRELQEETGFKAGRLDYWCSTHHSETLRTANHLFLGQDLSSSPLPRDHDEMMEVHEVSITEAIEKVLGSPTIHAVSAVALLRFARENP